MKERCLNSFNFDHQGETISFQQLLDSTYTDGMLVLHQGDVIFEYYVAGMIPSDTHLLMSASKSLTAALCGVLVERGDLGPDDLVGDHIHELSDGAWQGCTIQNLLDMRTGVLWNYDVDEYTILDVSDYRTHSRQNIAPDTKAWILSIKKSGGHGGTFRYCSLATDLLGWVLERAGDSNFAELFSEEIWSAIGAEYDAEILRDNTGFSVVEGGICTTLRDFARFGQMCLRDGWVDGKQVVPTQWLDRLRCRDNELIDAYSASPEYDPAKPDAFYHDNWWITDAESGIYSALGMNGQQLLIHRPSCTVVAKFSTHPDALDTELSTLQDVGLIALCESLD